MDTLADLLDIVLGGDSPDASLGIGQVAARSAVLYVIGLVVVRLGKSRVLSRATPLDIILGIVLGSLLSRGITGGASISGTTAAAVTLIAFHWVLTALCCHYHGLGNLVKGHAHLLISNGEIDWKSMRQSHISQHDLLEELRLNANIDDPSQVKCAYKERSGDIGVVKRDDPPRIVEVAVQPGVQVVRIELVRS
jgi:uncharacterized membrane protein YcaP (DUF421 family)